MSQTSALWKNQHNQRKNIMTETLLSILGLEGQTRYTIKYGGNDPTTVGFDAKNASTDEELADVLEEFVAMLRAPKKEVIGENFETGEFITAD